MIAMMHAAADQIDHAIFDFQIIVVNGQRYFAFVKLNVNWWDPCTLYEYEGGELRELAQWDNMRLLSVGSSEIHMKKRLSRSRQTFFVQFFASRL